LSAMGLSRKSSVEEGSGKGTQASVSCTKCRVADQWAVEMCYISIDDIAERVIEHVVEKEVIVEKIVEKIVEVEKPVIRTVKEIVEIEVPVERIIEQKVEVLRYIEVEKPPTRTMGTQTDVVEEPAPETPKVNVRGSRLSAHVQAQPIFAPQARKENVGAVRVGGGFEVVGSVPDVLKKGALSDTEAQGVLASTKAETMQRMAGVQDVASRRSITSAKPRSSTSGSNEACKEVYGLVRGMTPDRTKGIHRSQEVLSAEISKGGKAPPAPAGHVFGTFLRGSQERQRFGHDRGSRTPFRVYRSRVTSDDACDVAPVMRRSQSQPIRRPSSAGPSRSSVPLGQERGFSPGRPSQTLDTTAVSTIEAATTASFSGLGMHRSSGSESASLSTSITRGRGSVQ